MPTRIRFEQIAGVAHVTLSYPKRFNAMSRSMWRDLQNVFECIQGMAELRCVLVAGEGSNFCAGGDISEYASFRFQEPSLRAFHEEEVWGALSAMLACDVPMVAQIEGNCMGAGVEIASCCDIRLAAESARFGAPIARLGFPMAPREAALVAREAGVGTTRQMLLEAKIFSAPDMLQRGFLSRVVADADISDLAQASVQRICQLAPQAARLNKQTLRAFTHDQLPALLATAYDYADSAEQREGINAFLEKRQPAF